MPEHAYGRAPDPAFDLESTRPAVLQQCHHVIVLARAMYTGQRVCQATPPITSQVPPMAAWATWPPRLLYMDDGCAHVLLAITTLSSTLVRLQCGGRMRAIAIRATPTLEVEGGIGGLNLLRSFGLFRDRVILGLLLCPCLLVTYCAIVLLLSILSRS